MILFDVYPSFLKGVVTVPPSKSHTLRAILFAALAQGISCIEDYLPSPDTTAMIEAVRLLGVEVRMEGSLLVIHGCNGKPMPPKDVIQCGNSGQVLRFIGALAGLMPKYTLLTGDASIRKKRPVQPLLEGLTQLGATAFSALDNGYAPLLIKGPFTQTSARVSGEDSQPISGLLMAGAFTPDSIELHVDNPGEKPWIDLTLHWFRKMGIPYQCLDYKYYRMEGNACVKGFNYRVPGDFSTAAFPIAAAIVTNSELTLQNIDMEDCQGDKALISLLKTMGAHFDYDAKAQTLVVKSGAKLKGSRIDVNDFVDALPILAVLGCFAEGRTEIFNGAVARYKESDRIHSIAQELKKMGAHIEEKPDGLVVQGSELKGAELSTYHDHRMAMALTVAALAAKTPSTIIDIECVAKTYPTFYEDFVALGAKIRRIEC